MFGGGGGVYISGTEHNMQLKFSILTYLTHIKTLLEYYHVSLIIDDLLYVKDGNLYRLVLKNKFPAMFFLKKPFSSLVGISLFILQTLSKILIH